MNCLSGQSTSRHGKPGQAQPCSGHKWPRIYGLGSRWSHLCSLRVVYNLRFSRISFKRNRPAPVCCHWGCSSDTVLPVRLRQGTKGCPVHPLIILYWANTRENMFYVSECLVLLSVYCCGWWPLTSCRLTTKTSRGIF